MRTIEQIRRFKTKNFSVHVNAVEDDDLDLSFDDTGEVREGLESGKYVGFAVEVKVYFQGAEVSSDALCGCIYESPRAFMDHLGINHYSPAPGKIPEGTCGSCFVDMIRSAIEEARKHIAAAREIHIRKP